MGKVGFVLFILSSNCMVDFTLYLRWFLVLPIIYTSRFPCTDSAMRSMMDRTLLLKCKCDMVFFVPSHLELQ